MPRAPLLCAAIIGGGLVWPVPAAAQAPAALPRVHPEAVECSTRSWDRATSFWLGSDVATGSSCSCETAAECEAQRARIHGCIPASCFAGCIPASAFESWRCLELDTSARFCDEGPSDQAFNVSVLLSTSDVSLDCNGRTIEPSNPANFRSRGIAAVYERSLRGVEIRNCTIRNAQAGIDLKRFFRGDEPNLVSPSRFELEARADAPAAALDGHRDIRIENTRVLGCDIGIYVGQNSRFIDIDGVEIRDSTAIGIYVEAGTTDSRIVSSAISGTRRREAIALDSCERVLVSNCEIRGLEDGTRAGRIGIALYHNCGEQNGSVCPVVRPLGASRNTIRHNVFIAAGVSVAPRQYQAHGPAFCLDRTFGRARYTVDRAEHNEIVGNRFLAGAALHVYDGPISILGNYFEGPLGLGVQPPTDCGRDCPSAERIAAVVRANVLAPTASVDIAREIVDFAEWSQNVGLEHALQLRACGVEPVNRYAASSSATLSADAFRPVPSPASP